MNSVPGCCATAPDKLSNEPRASRWTDSNWDEVPPVGGYADGRVSGAIC